MGGVTPTGPRPSPAPDAHAVLAGLSRAPLHIALGSEVSSVYEQSSQVTITQMSFDCPSHDCLLLHSTCVVRVQPPVS
jgi:hypothetical protein